jgi:serine/threonine protein kinase
MPEQPKSDPPPRSQDAPRSPDTATLHNTGTPAAGFDLKPGARPVAEFELLHRLGHGGFGEVWKAAGAGGVEVALKFIRLDDQAGAVEQRSLDLMKNLRHAHLLGCFGAWQRDGFLILALELADSSLHDRLRQALGQGLPGLPGDELHEYLREAAKGLDYLNGQQVQHRDVKPENLLLVGGSIKVADFGLAKLVPRSVVSNTGVMTWQYAPPEFFSGQTSSLSDQYSLAATYCRCEPTDTRTTWSIPSSWSAALP